MSEQDERRERYAAAMREHGMVHLGDQVPSDEYEGSPTDSTFG